MWKRLRTILRTHVNPILGIATIESGRLSRGEQDRVFRMTLRELMEREEKMQTDMRHLESRHDYLNAVVKAGPYAVISSFVALVWVLLAEEWMTLIPASVIVVVGLMVIACNRLANEAETEIGSKRVDLAAVEGRLRVREEDVKAAVVRAKDKAPDVFDDYFKITFSKDFFRDYRKQLRDMMPDSESPRYGNMKFRHKECFEIAEKLVTRSTEFIDTAEDWMGMVARKMNTVQPASPTQDPEDREQRLQKLSRALVFCFSENVVKRTQLDALQSRGKFDSSFSPELALATNGPYRALLVDPELKGKAAELDALRDACGELRKSILREVSVLYG